ncbi:MAG TPA: VOC family protein [Dermatophilaceae bacterium]
MTFDRLHHVQLAMPTGEEQAARAFFVGVLGMVEIDKPPVLTSRGGAWFRKDGVELHLGVEDDFRPARKAHPALAVTGIEALCAGLVAAGHPVRRTEDVPGIPQWYVDDPFGNRIELVPARGPDHST